MAMTSWFSTPHNDARLIQGDQPPLTLNLNAASLINNTFDTVSRATLLCLGERVGLVGGGRGGRGA